MLGRNVNVKIVSELLGHSRSAITTDHYSHVTPTMQREAAAAMKAAIGGGR
jgi:integrase